MAERQQHDVEVLTKTYSVLDQSSSAIDAETAKVQNEVNGLKGRGLEGKFAVGLDNAMVQWNSGAKKCKDVLLEISMTLRTNLQHTTALEDSLTGGVNKLAAEPLPNFS